MFFRRKKEVEKADIDNELKIILEFFNELEGDRIKILKLLKEMLLLRKKSLEMEKADVSEGHIKKQEIEELKKWDEFLKQFIFLNEDIDIAAERVKKISSQLLTEAEGLHVEKELAEKTKDDNWMGKW